MSTTTPGPQMLALTGYIGGLTISNNGSDADHDIDIAVGSARDYTDAVTMKQGTAALTKRIDATWAVGDGNGGLDSTDTVGNNTGYGVYLIRRSDTGVVDVLISSDMTAAGSALTMPTNYDQKRLIGWVRTDGSANILAFVPVGDNFRLTTQLPSELADTTIASHVAETVTLTVPPLSTAWVILYSQDTGSSAAHNEAYVYIGGGLEGADSLQATMHVMLNSGDGSFDSIGDRIDVLTNASGQITYRAYESSDQKIYLKLQGCLMNTRSNP